MPGRRSRPDTDWADLYRIDGFTFNKKLEQHPHITKVDKKKVGMENGASSVMRRGLRRSGTACLYPDLPRHRTTSRSTSMSSLHGNDVGVRGPAELWLLKCMVRP